MGASAEKRAEYSKQNRFTKRNRFSNDGPFEIEIVGDSSIARFERERDFDNLADFNSKIQQWSVGVKSDLVASIKSLVKEDTRLSKSLKNNLYSDNKKWNGHDEIDRLGFSFRPSGVFIHLGVGRGYKMDGGTVRKYAKTNTFARKPILWFNPVIENHIKSLSEIVSAYSENLIINYSRIYIN